MPVQQLISIIERVSHRFNAFIPYLQPYSNTYGPVSALRCIYESLITIPKVVGLAVGTRPDCFDPQLFDYLAELSGRTYLSIELGLQSCHDTTLAAHNRGHTFSDFVRVVSKLHDIGIETVAHVIIGLRGETSDMIMATAKQLAQLPVDGVKIHQLMVIRGTEIEHWYSNGAFAPLSLPEYSKLVSAFLAHLRPNQHIHRIIANSHPDFGLVAPLWSAEKQKSLAFIHDYMNRYEYAQGIWCSS
jgi:uncharacterized protein